jgi:hypothetical protein
MESSPRNLIEQDGDRTRAVLRDDHHGRGVRVPRTHRTHPTRRRPRPVRRHRHDRPRRPRARTPRHQQRHERRLLPARRVAHVRPQATGQGCATAVRATRRADRGPARPTGGDRMTIHYQGHGVTLHHGDCLDVLRTLPDASVDSVVTDPPYGLDPSASCATAPDATVLPSPSRMGHSLASSATSRTGDGAAPATATGETPRVAKSPLPQRNPPQFRGSRRV